MTAVLDHEVERVGRLEIPGLHSGPVTVLATNLDGTVWVRMHSTRAPLCVTAREVTGVEFPAPANPYQLTPTEIEVLIAECLGSLDGVPHLVIRCHSNLADAVRQIATDRIHTSGFTGRLVVMGDPEIVLGDCRIEWVDGGLVRDQAAIASEIDGRIADFLAARGINTGASGAGEHN